MGSQFLSFPCLEWLSEMQKSSLWGASFCPFLAQKGSVKCRNHHYGEPVPALSLPNWLTVLLKSAFQGAIPAFFQLIWEP